MTKEIKEKTGKNFPVANLKAQGTIKENISKKCNHNDRKILAKNNALFTGKEKDLTGYIDKDTFDRLKKQKDMVFTGYKEH